MATSLIASIDSTEFLFPFKFLIPFKAFQEIASRKLHLQNSCGVARALLASRSHGHTRVLDNGNRTLRCVFVIIFIQIGNSCDTTQGEEPIPGGL